MKLIRLSGVLLGLSIGAGGVTSAEDSAVVKELAPTGKLRVGVAFAPAATPLFVAKDAAGQPHGVTVDLGTALARSLGVPSTSSWHPIPGS